MCRSSTQLPARRSASETGGVSTCSPQPPRNSELTSLRRFRRRSEAASANYAWERDPDVVTAYTAHKPGELRSVSSEVGRKDGEHLAMRSALVHVERIGSASSSANALS